MSSGIENTKEIKVMRYVAYCVFEYHQVYLTSNAFLLVKQVEKLCRLRMGIKKVEFRLDITLLIDSIWYIT